MANMGRKAKSESALVSDVAELEAPAVAQIQPAASPGRGIIPIVLDHAANRMARLKQMAYKNRDVKWLLDQYNQTN